MSWGHYQILCSLHSDASLGNAQHGRLWTLEGEAKLNRWEVFCVFKVHCKLQVLDFWLLSCSSSVSFQILVGSVRGFLAQRFHSFHVQPSIPCTEVNDAGHPMTSLLSQKFGLAFQLCYAPWTCSEPLWAAPNGSPRPKDTRVELRLCQRDSSEYLTPFSLLILFVTASYGFMRFSRTVECCCLDVGASQESHSRHLLTTATFSGNVRSTSL